MPAEAKTVSGLARLCALGGYLTAPTKTPPLVCERGLHALGVGCNRLRCHDCGAWVRWDGAAWVCDCRVAEVRDVYLARQDHDGPPELPWACAGHPDATDDDRHALGFGAVEADVARALVATDAPAHHPPGHAGYAIDVRLDLGPYDEAAVRGQLTRALDGDEPRPAWRAMDALHFRGWTPIDGAVDRWERLRTLPNPRFPKLDLGRTWARVVAEASRGDLAPVRALMAAGAPDLERFLRGG